ncbi:MAG TPA: M14 family metallopeptidase [Actinomycetota bacterium]|nr:M14 family metallopeptidase [Actinomycetota bacterium]
MREGRGISRRELLRRAGLGLGAVSVGRLLGAGPAWAATGTGAAARAAEAAGVTEPLMLARVKPTSAAQAVALAAFDDTHRRFRDGSIEVLLWPGDLARLEQLGIDHTITCRDVVARDASESEASSDAPALGLINMPGGDRTGYRQLADYENELKQLPRTYPHLARLITFPERTLEGRLVHGIEIAANVGVVDGRPMAYIDGVHHAREWPAAEYPMIFAHYLLENYGKDQRVTSLLNRCRVSILPVQNPDGFAYTRAGLENSNLSIVAGGQGAYWRKNRRGVGQENEANGLNPTAFGVDPNRNYPFLWGATTGGAAGYVDPVPAYASTSPNPLDQTYYGRDALSEPETRNVAGYLLSRNVTGMITNHTYGRLVLRPWGHTNTPTVDETLMRTVGAQMASAMGGYANQIGLGLYPTTGTTDDWYYAAASAIGYTFEHGTAFHPNYTSGENAVRNFWPRSMNAFMILCEAAADPAKHCVVRGRAIEPVPGQEPKPVVVSLDAHKEFDTPMWQQGATGIGPLLAQKTATREVLDLNSASDLQGVIEWHLNPTTRPLEAAAGRTETYRLRIAAPGYRPKIQDIVLTRGEVLDLQDVVMERA